MTTTEFASSLFGMTDIATVTREFPDLTAIVLTVGTTDSGRVYPRYNTCDFPFNGGCYAGNLTGDNGPWVADGFDLRVTKDLVDFINDRFYDYNELLAIARPFRDLQQHVADFYLLEALMYLVPFDRIGDSIITQLGYGNIAALLDNFSPEEKEALLRTSDDYSPQENFCLEVALYFNQFVERFGRVLYEYCFYAIGSELRHCPVQNLLTGNSRAAYEILCRLRHALGANGDLMVLEWAKKAFKPKSKGGMWKWEDAYGGTAWARCTDIILNYRKGKLSKQLFVDRICTVQHNTGSFLNKGSVFSTNHLHNVLNAHHNSDFGLLPGHASPEVTKLYVRAGELHDALHLLPRHLQPGTQEASLYGLQKLVKTYIK